MDDISKIFFRTELEIRGDLGGWYNDNFDNEFSNDVFIYDLDVLLWHFTVKGYRISWNSSLGTLRIGYRVHKLAESTNRELVCFWVHNVIESAKDYLVGTGNGGGNKSFSYRLRKLTQSVAEGHGSGDDFSELDELLESYVAHIIFHAFEPRAVEKHLRGVKACLDKAIGQMDRFLALEALLSEKEK